MTETKVKEKRNKAWHNLAYMFCGLWLMQWIIAAYTYEIKFAYGGGVTLLAVVCLIIGIDINKTDC
jgi:hypothetical protein